MTGAPLEGLVDFVLTRLNDGPVEITFEELLDRADLQAQPLSGAQWITNEFAALGVQIRPPLGHADDGRHVLSIPALLRMARHDPLAAVGKGEHHRQEFKESLQIDCARMRHAPETPLKDLKRPELIDACLKTISAFCNSEGGTLWVGVADDGAVRGVERDLALFGRNPLDKDFFENHLRSLVKDRFGDGDLVNDFVDISCHDLSDAMIVEIRVRPRKARLTCFRNSDGATVAYKRQGNRSALIEICSVQDFLRDRDAV